ncbi:MAG: UDP-N-acetylmuramoyl-L-alanyl-D-glutamate-2,6-diaminopimelate ligase [Candidatus Jorgensenbacteria bacterium GW2011_GWA1_48_11]|uniref:UDP-N-acetylmuramoyl-L-alanyl-D-glutamate-2, 6-diaminopimelate ligase n=1 Tax=Candidatus Jorgensenbacteria bacterium GW2011_GWA1_48_11 TaxID=1618660 RepID=A0A0G1UBQ1_9BACT|nr:MAG: UDP-N-acetylmuramoyl-L-alanyl-D-glutamate-2,6-diaminopimelate ligase [Candidatus Jorgensenbacteria bacterium GW2011_GWA1_48_11]KKW12045.1 MAG: UDP-N-acetylmuramoyl-L-alanyl-D-glutamate-2,6-diaminopimelate ligase [Candidatus Jorgensenbacteria bacterium GW2011_GWB1_49_9]
MTMRKIRNFYHWFLALLGSCWYGRPSRKIFVLGVTGTKGKSTVLELTNAILEAGGKKTALLSSIRRKVGRKTEENLTGNTMPGRFQIQRFLDEAVRAGAEFALIEVTSEGVLQHRHEFTDWDAAIMTNLAPEHIEHHGSFENYRAAKLKFFQYLAFSKKTKKYFFINEEDGSHHYFEEAARRTPNREIILYSRHDLVNHEVGRRYKLNSKAGRRLLGDWLLADFNLENAAAAVAFARTQNIDWPIIEKALTNFRGAPGRLEFVQKEPFAVVVDYAHTPDSLKQVYETLEPKSFKPRSRGKMICVLGSAGGGRDKWKRPEIGKIAATYCDKIVLTNEDPYDENPNEIIRQIENGFLEATVPKCGPEDHFRVLDRRAALKHAVSLAKKGDVVVITGKGSEAWLHLARGEKIPWNERKMAEEILRNASQPMI